MKKAVAIPVLIFITLAISIYLFIPNVISFKRSVFVSASRDGLSRKLFNEKNWTAWWPRDEDAKASNFLYNSSSFSVGKKSIASIYISVDRNGVTANTSLNIISKDFDTTQLIWTGTIPTSYNPFKRVQTFFESRSVINGIDSVLQKIKLFYSKTENVYDFDIREVAVVDSLVASTYSISKEYPSVDVVYALIDQLHQYIASHNAIETGYPMLNVSTNDSISFLARVAIPVNKTLSSSGTISIKQMPVGGNIFVVDVKGGPQTVQHALHQVENFITDHHRSSPAIPFLSLITNRRDEPDTSKWLTRIYYPVM
jgi:hypothetical protein